MYSVDHPTQKHQNFQKTIIFWLGIVFSLLAVYFSMKDIQISQVSESLKSVKFDWMLGAFFVSVFTIFSKAARWRWLFNNRPSFQQSLLSQSIGAFLNIFTPARMGDLFRAYLLGKQTDLSKLYALSTIGIEKLFDMLFLLISIGLLSLWIGVPEWILQSTRTILLICIGFAFALFLIVKNPNKIQTSLLGLQTRIKWNWLKVIIEKILEVIHCFQVLNDKRTFIILFVWSFIVWVLGFLTNILVFLALGMPSSLPMAIFLLIVLQVGVAVPSSPGRLGVFHYLTILALSVFEISNTVALSCSFILYLVVMIPIVALGTFSILKLSREGR